MCLCCCLVFCCFFRGAGVAGVQVIYFSDISALLLCTPALHNALP